MQILWQNTTHLNCHPSKLSDVILTAVVYASPRCSGEAVGALAETSPRLVRDWSESGLDLDATVPNKITGMTIGGDIELQTIIPRRKPP